MQDSKGQESIKAQLDSANRSSNLEDSVKLQLKPKIGLIFVGILAVMACLGILLTLGGTLGFVSSTIVAMSGTGLPEQIIIMFWSIATLGMIIFAGALIIGAVGLFARIIKSVVTQSSISE